MLLFIDTTIKDKIYLELWQKEKMIGKKIIKAPKAQAEKLLVGIDRILGSHNLKINDIKEIKVNNYGGTFTSLRVGVSVANALTYSLAVSVRGVKEEKNKRLTTSFCAVKAFYNTQPNITL